MAFKVTPRWQMTVHWWEMEEGNPLLVRKDATFSSVEEVSSFMQKKVEEGVLYDIIGTVESTWSEVEGDLPRIEEDQLNGFAGKE